MKGLKSTLIIAVLCVASSCSTNQTTKEKNRFIGRKAIFQ